MNHALLAHFTRSPLHVSSIKLALFDHFVPLSPTGIVHQPSATEPDDGHTEESSLSESHLRQVRPVERSVVAAPQSVVHARRSHAQHRYDGALPHAASHADTPHLGEKRWVQLVGISCVCVYVGALHVRDHVRVCVYCRQFSCLRYEYLV